MPLLSENYFPPSGEPPGGAGRFVALAMPLLVLLITCTNVSALLAGIALSRRREIAVRLSLGAHRRRIVRQLLTETSLLALCAGALGLGVVAIIIRVFDATVLGAPLMIDWRAGVFTALLALATGLIFGLSPALHATRLAVSDVLKESDVVSRRSRLQASLVVAQIALTQPALLGMGALLLELREDLNRSSTSRLGDQVLEVRFNTNPRYGAIDERREEAIQRLRRRLENVPGVRAVVPQDLMRDSARVSSHDADRVPGVSGADDVSVSIHSAPPGYFAALGRELERGREFGPAERSSDDLVVIDRALAQRLWGDVTPIGRRLIADDAGYPRNAGVFTVIGVADDRGPRGLFLPDVSVTSHLLIRTDGPAETFAQAIRAVALAEAPEVPIVAARSLAAVEAAAQLPALQGIATAGGSGLLALGLAAIGLYGVVAVTVAQRVREIGIRTALGADRRRIVRLFVARGLRLSLAGLDDRSRAQCGRRAGDRGRRGRHAPVWIAAAFSRCGGVRHGRGACGLVDSSEARGGRRSAHRAPRRLNRNPGRRFGARRFAERIHRNRRVLDVEDLEVFGLRRRVQDDAIARARLHQRARQRRHPADVAAVHVDFVDANDADDVLVACLADARGRFTRA